MVVKFEDQVGHRRQADESDAVVERPDDLPRAHSELVKVGPEWVMELVFWALFVLALTIASGLFHRLRRGPVQGAFLPWCARRA